MNREPDKINEFGKYWYDENEKIHNDNGHPAIIFVSGSKHWCKHGKSHNDNGPAIIHADGFKRWYIDGEQLTEEEFKQHKIKQFIND